MPLRNTLRRKALLVGERLYQGMRFGFMKTRGAGIDKHNPNIDALLNFAPISQNIHILALHDPHPAWRIGDADHVQREQRNRDGFLRSWPQPEHALGRVY